jgi:transposase InsO family protein
MRKKALSPASRRAYALEAVEEGLGSGRKVCRILEVPRSSYWYRPREKTPWEQRLLERMIELSDKHPRYGYRRIAALLRQEGWAVGKRRIQSLRRSLGLRVPPTKRKIIRRGHSTGLPVKAEYKGHVWTWDFICDGTTRGGALRMLTILDEYTRECHVLRADRALKSGDVLEWMSRAIQQHGAPAFLRSDNGSEFIAKTVQKWLSENQIKTIYIEPGSPWQNGYVESFHGRLRDECLNREQFWTLTEARVVIEDYRREYNTFRPHSKLGYLSPARFAARKTAPSPSPVGLRPPCAGDGQTNTNQLETKIAPKD